MSAYIVNNKTISAIAKAFVMYGATYSAENYNPNPTWIKSLHTTAAEIGQSLLEQNYASVNFRYREETPAPPFEYADVDINEGIVTGCIDCYIYQACETNDFETSELYYSLIRLKDRVLERLIKRAGQEMPWGIE